MLVTLAHQIFESTDVAFHFGGSCIAVAPPAGVENALVRLQNVCLVAYRITDAVLLTRR